MMLALALDHASKGYPVFPAQQDKRPKKGLNDWENNASTDPEQIKQWWAEDPNFLPAIPPGRLGLAVIDLDRHEGQDSGFDSLDKANITIRSDVFGTSLSGNGLHYWHRHDIGSLNRIYPGVDRKAHGGYVVVPYELPLPEKIIEPLPEELSAGVKSRNVERKTKTNLELNEWLQTIGYGVPDDDMWKVVEAFEPRGNQQMSVNIAKVVSLAARGHPGASRALERMSDIWLSEPHNSGDPEEEFQVNVRSAIEKFGEPVPDTSGDEAWDALVNPPEPPVDIDAMRDSLLQHCINYRPDFMSLLRTRQAVYDAFVKCDEVAKKVTTHKQATEWLKAAPAAMRRVLDREQETD